MIACHARNTHGFTLLEMLVALAIMGVLATSMYSSLHIAFRARQSAQAAIEPVRTASLALELVRADLEGALPPTGILAGSFVGLDETDSASGADADTLAWHANVGRPAQGVGDAVRLELAVAPIEGTGQRALVRRLTTNLLAPKAPEPAEEILCRGVLGLNLSYFDGSTWLESWDSGAQSNTLPLAVEAKLEVQRLGAASADAGSYVLTRVFVLPCGSLPEAGSARVIGGSSR